MATLQLATPAHIEAIQHITWANWDVQFIPAIAQSQIDAADASIIVALHGDDVVGYVSGFLTRSLDDDLRWQVDLVAVDPAQHGQGIGTQLIRAAWRQAAHLNAQQARALIGEDNVASQRAFEKAGFACQRRRYHMYLWSPWESEETAHRIPFGVRLLPVDTLTYRGLWIEGLDPKALTPTQQHEVVQAARIQTAREGRYNTSALIPITKDRYLDSTLRSIAALHGTYQWWERTG